MEPKQPRSEVPAEKSSATKALTDRAAETYQWWDNLATINAEDPFLVGAVKIGVRLLGVVILLALSPVILLGIIIAFLAVL
ncbi:hypothetical protein [Neolewinella litorea]|uniref:AI-2E family transporter n=1 Tax=Neolewinella litorea TaxID=2562452 RepID=A0A4S4NL49_9BACT|nr:hypothetical protein [Neolewinella litorea]THH40512.1 hypothetical protein E4021_07185 [Neolewinella litorea]